MSRTYVLGSDRHFRDGGAPKPASREARAPLPTQRLGGPLSNDQKARLCILAKDAYLLQPGASRCPDAATLDAFRHAEVAHATGKPGLTACTQDDWNLLHAHFLALTGETGQAFNAAVKHGTEPKRIAEFKLNQALQKAGLPPADAAKICRSKYKCALEDATAPQLWKLTFDINRIAAARRRAR